MINHDDGAVPTVWIGVQPTLFFVIIRDPDATRGLGVYQPLGIQYRR